jgi:hypothetical protein
MGHKVRACQRHALTVRSVLGYTLKPNQFGERYDLHERNSRRYGR